MLNVQSACKNHSVARNDRLGMIFDWDVRSLFCIRHGIVAAYKLETVPLTAIPRYDRALLDLSTSAHLH